MGRAYCSGEKEKAGSAFRNLYFNLPTAPRRMWGNELRKLGIRARHPSAAAAPICYPKPNTTRGPMSTALSKKSVRRTGQMCNWHWRERLKKAAAVTMP